MKKELEKRIIISALVILSVVLLFVLPLGHDLWFHVYRIGAMATELRNNPWQVPIRMLSDTYNGYGYGAALYYGDLFLYIPAILVCLGMNEVVAYKLFTVMILWTTFGIAYASARMMEKDNKTAIYFSLFYTFSSYGLLNLCIRSAIGESLAFAFLPLVISSFWNILYGKSRRRDRILLGSAMAAIVMSHMLTFVLCVVVLCVWCILDIRIVMVFSKFLEFVKAAFLMLGLSASFLFPLFEQMLYQTVQTPGNSDYQKQAFMNYSIEWMDYFIPYDIKKIVATVLSVSWDLEYWHPGTIGLFAIMILGIGLVIKSRFSKRQIGVMICTIGALVLLGIRNVMEILKEFMAFMQFPWRILTFITLGTAFCGMWIVENMDAESKKKSRNLKFVLLLGTLCIAFLAIGPRYAYQIYVQRNNYEYVRENNPEFYHKYLIQYDKNAADALYLPEGTYLYTYQDRGEVVSSNNENVEYQWQRQQKQIDIQVQNNPYTDSTLEVPLFIYKGYVAENAKGIHFPIEKSNNGLVNVVLGDYVGDIQIKYQGTLVQKISDMITLITILGMILMWKMSGSTSEKNRVNL